MAREWVFPRLFQLFFLLQFLYLQIPKVAKWLDWRDFFESWRFMCCKNLLTSRNSRLFGLNGSSEKKQLIKMHVGIGYVRLGQIRLFKQFGHKYWEININDATGIELLTSKHHRLGFRKTYDEYKASKYSIRQKKNFNDFLFKQKKIK